MNFWAYGAPLRFALSFLDFCAVYFTTLLGRCAMLSLPVLGLVLLLRETVWKRRTFAKGAAWAALLLVPFLGRLAVYYKHRVFLPFVLWQSWCSGYWWVRYGYLLGVAAGVAGLCLRRSKLDRMLRGLPTAYVGGQKVCLCDMPVSPFTAGVLSPKIVLPKIALEQLDENELRTILLHERTHIRLAHLWYFLLWDVLCALLWADPFLRLATPWLKEDMEQICDAVTIRHSGRDAASYGRVILKSFMLLRAGAPDPPVAFAGEADLAGAKRRISRVRDYRPYSRRAAAALCVCTVGLLLTAALAIHRASLPRCTDLTGFQIFHVSEDIEFTTLYESETDKGFPVKLNGSRAEVDNAAFWALLPESAPKDGWYYVMWGGFLKLPGIGGALNSIYVDVRSDGQTVSAEFQDVNDLFYVKLAKRL